MYDGLLADKDALLFATTMHFDLDPHLHSPVILGKGATTDFLDHPERFDYVGAIREAADLLESRNDVVVYEGTGHPGVGSVVNLSNADVARLLQAPVVLVAEGGIGNTIDMLNMNHALFREQNVPLLGVIINKTLPEKIEKVRRYVGQWLAQKRIPLLGVLPYDDSMANPTMDIICEAVNGWVIANESALDNRVEQIISGSLIEQQEFAVHPHTLMIVNYKRLDPAFEVVQRSAARAELPQSPIAGIIIHGEHSAVAAMKSFDYACMPQLLEARIPLIATTLDTYGSAVRISHLEVKINTKTPWKIQRAVEMVRENIPVDLLIR